jgi:hypothetical protein
MTAWLLVQFAACGDEEASETGAASAVELQTAELGSFDLSDTGWYSEEIAIDVPEGAVSSMFTCGAFGPDAVGTIYDLIAPDGTVVYNGDDPPSWGGFRSEYLDDQVPGLLPTTPVQDILPGTWKARWFVGAGNGRATVDCRAVHRVDTVSTAPTVAVDLVFVGLSGINGLKAALAPDHAEFQAALDIFRQQWATAGIEVTLNYRDFEGDVDRFAVVDITDDDSTEFNELLATVAPANPRTVTFFFVQEIANASGGTILGLAGGPPGAAALNGTSKSGVIVTAADLVVAPDDVGRIMAHEGGHFLGLYHTTERDGARFDPIGDTPECDPSKDANANGEMNSTECAGAGAENIMWWTLTTGDASFSGDQTWVLARNPAVD